ncbi:2Fe-2S iron-sulfur cluster-binding protein [Seohaeicola saemankumensis]|uniref:2Fe-2S iron-sulfur cluster-binding protein n=1 Tax=Seohaeicola saemankumensis TaxID=481181 RepID=A0ABW3TC45_9RHOB
MKVTWILPDGSEISVEVAEGLSLMEAAVAHNVPGVVGECGGNLSCATCHVHVADAWADRVGGPEDFEDAMLDTVEAARVPTSRLSCQIRASAALDGLVLIVPEV